MIKSDYFNSLKKASLISLLSVLTVGTINANENIVETNVNENELSWTSTTEGSNFMLRVTGPDNFVFEKTFRGTPPAINAFGPDGQYRYEITALPVLTDADKMAMRIARKTNNLSAMRTLKKQSQKQSGYFRVQGGAILNSNEEETKDTK